MKIFLTGATGFVGRALSTFLTDGMTQIHQVVGLVHDVDMQVFNKLPNPPFSVIFGDIRDYKRMREILYHYHPDAIIHLAAKAIVSEAQQDPLDCFEVNVGGTISLLNAFHEVCPQSYFLYFSTDKVYGNGLEKKESDPVQATGYYESSKAAADLIAQTYAKFHPNMAITRTCNIYGPGDRNSRIIPNTIRECLRGDTRPWIYKNSGSREYIYIQDVCRIISQIVEGKKTGVWNIGSGQVLTNEQVVMEILKHFPKLEPAYGHREMPELVEQSLNTENLCRKVDCLSFETFQSGITKTVDWWLKNA